MIYTVSSVDKLTAYLLCGL